MYTIFKPHIGFKTEHQRMEETHVASPPLRKKFFWVLFYIAGCTFTIIYWKKSIENFYSYPSLITEERHQSDKEKCSRYLLYI